MFEEFQETANTIYEQAIKEGRLISGPYEHEIRKLASKEPEVEFTNQGSIVATSEPNSRSAMHTKNNIDSEFGVEESQLLKQTKQILSTQQLISANVSVGTSNRIARAIVPARHAHVLDGFTKLFTPLEHSATPTYTMIMFFDDKFESNKTKPLPEKDITIRLAHSPEGQLVKIIKNSNYLGEFKKGVFAGENYLVKVNSKGIFLHAGCRQDLLEQAHGNYGLQNSLFIALSANGKTSLTGKVLARKSGEESWLIQDDGGTLRRDSSFEGFEERGLYIKTDRLSPHDQIEAYYGALKSSTFLENVFVSNGKVDFTNTSITSNGRAVIRRQDLMHSSPDIDVDTVNNIFLITRGNIIPAITRLTSEQATAYIVLGQSMQSSAGDPTQDGKIINQFFYDPFIAGDRTEHANLFYEIIKSNPHINFYLINTGGIGQGDNYRDISLGDSVGILQSVLRGGLEDWIESSAGGYVPRSVRDVDSSLLHPEKLFSSSQFEAYQKALNRKRTQILEQYKLPNQVKDIFKD